MGRTTQDLWTAAALGVVVLLAALDVALGGPGFEGLLLAGPVVAVVTLTPKRTALVAAAAVVAGFVVAASHAQPDTLADSIRLAGVAAVGAFCVLGSMWRERKEHVLQTVTRVAEVAQRAILRPIPSRVGPMVFASRYLSAAAQAFIGGDFYDVVPTVGGARVVIGDVRGKGLEAVHLAALVLGAFREAASGEDALDGVAAVVDRAVSKEITLEDFVTAVFVEVLPGGVVQVVNCGHHPPLRVSRRQTDYLAAAGASPPLGLGPEFTVQVHTLLRGDRLLLYTDGLLEARAPDGSFFELAPPVVSGLRRRNIDAALDGLVAELLRHAGGRLDDDLALLLAELR